MDNMSGLSGTDALSVMNATRNNYGYGCNDGFGMNGGWFWIILLLFFGRGNYGNYEGVQDNFISNEFIKRDIFNTNQNVSTTSCQTQRDILEGKYDTELSIANLAAQTQNCCCNTQKEILQSRYDNALGMQNLQAQLANCCCDLRTAIHAEGEATRGLIQANTIQDLRDRVADKDRELLTSGLAYQNTLTARTIVDSVLPRPIPAYPSCSPYVPFNYGCGCNTGCNY